MWGRKIKRGQVYWAVLNVGVGSEQYGVRPVLVIQNDKGNKHSPTVIIAVITGKNKTSLPTHVTIELDGLKKKSTVLLEQLRTIDKKRLQRYIGTIRDMQPIDRALSVSIGSMEDYKHER